MSKDNTDEVLYVTQSTKPGPEATDTTVTPEDSADRFLVRLTGPFWCTHLNVLDDQGDTLVIDRTGIEVPASALEAIHTNAALGGVTIESEPVT